MVWGTFGQYGYCVDGYDCIVQVPFGSTWTKSIKLMEFAKQLSRLFAAVLRHARGFARPCGYQYD